MGDLRSTFHSNLAPVLLGNYINDELDLSFSVFHILHAECIKVFKKIDKIYEQNLLNKSSIK